MIVVEPSDDRERAHASDGGAVTGGPGGGEPDEVILTGEAAKAAWRKVRWAYWVPPVVGLVAITLIWNLAHPTAAQTTLMALGMALMCRAAFTIFSGGFSGAKYTTTREDGQTTRRFTGKRSAFGPASALAYTIGGVLLVIAGTNSRVGRSLAPIPTAVLRAHDAFTSALAKPVAILFMVILVLFGLVTTFVLIAHIVTLIPKYRDQEDPSSIGKVLAWLLATAWVGFMFYEVLRNYK
jgi:hypothetical protein